MTLRESLEDRLRGAGYRSRTENVFEAAASRRTIVLMEASSEPTLWPERLESALRKDALRLVPSWSRYVVLLLGSMKTAELASAAAAFCRDVSKCWRLVAFADQTAQEVLPFLGLCAVPGGGGTPVHDVEHIAQSILGANDLSATFLDTHVPVLQLQKLAEEPGE